MARIDAKKCNDHGTYFGIDMHRIYERIGKSFKPIGWKCRKCNKIELDQKPVEEKKAKKTKRGKRK